MVLENVTGSLLAYKELEPGTFQHVDELTTERRDNHELRNCWLYTADGMLYTVQKGRSLLAITREAQNVVLQDIDKAYRQLTNENNYFPEAEVSRASLEHDDTVVVDVQGLELLGSHKQYGYFVVDPNAVDKLSSEQSMAALRIYGPDEDNFGLNMEMFAKAKKTPLVHVLRSDYVQNMLRSNDEEFLGRASLLIDFDYSSDFVAGDRGVDYRGALRGVRRVIAEGDAPENEAPRAPQEINSVGNVPLESILACLGDDVAPSVRPAIEARIIKAYRKAYKQ